MRSHRKLPSARCRKAAAGSLAGSLWTHQTSCRLASSPQVAPEFLGAAFRLLQRVSQWLHLLRRGGVVLEAVIAFNRDFAAFHVQDYVAEAPQSFS